MGCKHSIPESESFSETGESQDPPPFPPDFCFVNSESHIPGSSFKAGDLVWFEGNRKNSRVGRIWGQAKIDKVLPGGHHYKLVCQEVADMDEEGCLSYRDVHHPSLEKVPARSLIRIWDEITKPECPLSSSSIMRKQSAKLRSLEEVREKHGPDLGFCGTKQMGLGPEMCGINLQQLKSVMDMNGFHEDMTMTDVVKKLIVPRTKELGISYALLLNKKKPLRATHMVSHGWMEKYIHFIKALEGAQLDEEKTGLWVCSMAIYQCEDIPELTIERQLGEDVNRGPFATVLKQASIMLALLTPDSNIYTRMWCVLEIFVAIQLGTPVQLVSYRNDLNFHGVRGTSDAVVEHGKKRCYSKSARCGDPADPHMNSDERDIRALIERTDGGYDTLDSVVEWVKAMYLIDNTSQQIEFSKRQSAGYSSHPLLLGGGTYFYEKAQHLSAVANAIHRIHKHDDES